MTCGKINLPIFIIFSGSKQKWNNWGWKEIYLYSLYPGEKRIVTLVFLDGLNQFAASGKLRNEMKSQKRIIYEWMNEKKEPSLLDEGFLELVIGVGVEGVVQEVDIASSLERPHVLLEGLPLVPVLPLRRQKFRLWVYCCYLLHLGLRHCCCSESINQREIG